MTIRKYSKLGRPRLVKRSKIYKPERGCTRQFNKKYSKRPGPPYPANLCPHKIKYGNDGKIYKSIRKGRMRSYRWLKIK